MERVKKGEKYWIVIATTLPVSYMETDSLFDNRCFESGNYFPDKESAEAMAEKIRKVLKGADVIEMPSEEEAKAESERQLELSVACDDKWTEEAYLDGFADCLHWLKSKMVK